MSDTLFSRLAEPPVELKFGTSGRRGLVVHLTQLEIYLNARAELEYLLSLDDIRAGDEFYFAQDLRPTSPLLTEAIVRAVADAGLRPVNLGWIPTPALTAYAMAHARGSIMVTGSHIPFDRNGYKVNRSRGELRKEDEAPVNALAARWRERLYGEDYDVSPFDDHGRFKPRPAELPPSSDAAARAYLERYTDFFAGLRLDGLRLLVYQHSAVGRDLLVELLRRFGAEVVPAGRSETFVPIDTEAIGAAELAVIQGLVDEHGPCDAVLSLDGDSDRPLLLGVEPGTRRVRFFSGDLLGMVTAEYLDADAVVVPISCNDALDRGALRERVQPKTRIGSPFVIAGMDAARAQGKTRVCGWEPNGGFLTGSDFPRGGHTLPALPTRDAFLPLLAALFSARERGLSVVDRFAQLPRRYSRSALIRNFPRETGLRIVEFLTASRKEIPRFFPGFAAVESVDTTDGVRIAFAGGEIAHLRPSGNADEMRIYAVADTAERAEEIAAAGVAEPDGILRRLERNVKQ